MPRTRSERRSTWPAVVLASALLMPMLYVASFGPAAHLVLRDRMTMEKYQAVYAPIDWCERRSSIINRATGSYRWLFVDRKEWSTAGLVWLGRSSVSSI